MRRAASYRSRMPRKRSDADPKNRATRVLPYVGQNIKKHRGIRKMSQAALMDATGLTTIKLLETGDMSGSPESLIKIADALGIPVGALLDNPEDPLPEGLKSFLDSPAGRSSSVTPAEVDMLRVHARGRRPTEETYYWALKMLRSMKGGTS